MVGTIHTLSLTELQDLFYRSKFSSVLGELDKIEKSTGELANEKMLLKSNTLFELHRVPEARLTLKSLQASQDTYDDAILYASARLSYFDNKMPDARKLFQQIRENTRSRSYLFKSLLGIANTYYTERNFEALPPIVNELLGFEPIERDDERISLLIFLGNYYLTSGLNRQLGKQYFKKALSAAANNTWTYFITRSLYGIASVCEAESQNTELMWTLEMLQSFVDQSEQHFFSYVVNEKFKAHFSINTPMEFDTANKRILIADRWVGFHDRPLLFHFLLILHEKGNFVEKQAIANGLWPEENYKPRIHDPRIFDIARRARNLIEAYENQPVVLLSGRMGYKLASM